MIIFIATLLFSTIAGFFLAVYLHLRSLEITKRNSIKYTLETLIIPIELFNMYRFVKKNREEIIFKLQEITRNMSSDEYKYFIARFKSNSGLFKLIFRPILSPTGLLNVTLLRASFMESREYKRTEEELFTIRKDEETSFDKIYEILIQIRKLKIA
jgi:hypothetical protein